MRAHLGAVLFVAAVALATNGTATMSEPTALSIQCVKQPGFMRGPVVPTAKTAREIYIAVARAPELHRLEGRGPITVIDEGDRWGVTHYLEPMIGNSHHGKYHTVEVVAGGGKLAMQIDKCSGAVSMSLSR